MSSKNIWLSILFFLAVTVGQAHGSDSSIDDVTGKTFHVTVVSSFGTTFTDCYRFDTPGPGQLTIDQLGPPVTYVHGQLDAVGTSFKSVSLSSTGFGIEFHGAETTALQLLNGEAVSESGNSFVFSGPEQSPCSPLAASEKSPYAR